MTEMRIILPENKGIPIIVEHEDFFESDITLNLKFGSYELDFRHPIINKETNQCELCGEDVEMGGLGIPEINVKDNGIFVFSENFNHNWIMFLDITKQTSSKYKIDIKIYNMDDGDTCEICENNRFNFEINAIVDSYVYCFYSPPKGEFKKHLPTEVEELDEKIKEEMK